MTRLPRADRNTGMKNSAGFTLIEILVVMAVAAILLTVGVPSMRSMVLNNRLVTETNGLVGDVQLARSEAAKRNARTGICSSTDAAAASPTCASTTAWAAGWFSYVDTNSNGAYDDGTDTVLRRNQGDKRTSSNITVTASATDALIFNSDGSRRDGPATLRICDSRGVNFGRQIEITPVGRPELTIGTTTPLDGC